MSLSASTAIKGGQGVDVEGGVGALVGDEIEVPSTTAITGGEDPAPSPTNSTAIDVITKIGDCISDESITLVCSWI